MTHDRVYRVRGGIMFVVAWLIGLYIYEVVQEHFHGPIGFVAAAGSVAANLYARKKATACVPASSAFRFWLYLPVALFLVVPLAVKVLVYLQSEGDQGWWTHLSSLLPFLLKLGVPIAALAWLYVAVGKLRSPEASDSQQAAKQA